MKYERLGSLCTTQSGGTPRRGTQEFYDGPIPWAKIGDITAADGLLFQTEERITRSGLDSIGGRIFPAGTLLLAMYGSVGKIAIAGCELSTNQAILGIQPRDNSLLDSQFLRRWLEHIQPQLVGRARGVTQANISKSIVDDLEVPVPSITEQRKIAAILDKADAIRRKRQEAIALTEQLLRSTFLEMFGDPITNPKRWPTNPLGELATFYGGGTPSRSVSKYFTGNICWATSKDMKGELLSDTEEHITKEAIDNSATKLVSVGTILVVVKSKILMHRLPVLLTAVSTCFGQDLKGISPHNPDLTRYIARHLRIGQDTLLRRARGVNTEGLTLEHLREYSMMIPPSALIEKYTKIELAITKIQRDNQNANSLADNLFNSLVQRAFTGQL